MNASEIYQKIKVRAGEIFREGGKSATLIKSAEDMKAFAQKWDDAMTAALEEYLKDVADSKQG